MDEQPKTNILWWAAPAVVVVLLAIVAMFGGVEPPMLPPRQSTYDASPEGVRAVYFLLDGLGYNVTQSRRLSAGKVRWVLFPAPAGDQEDSGTVGESRPKRGGRSPAEEAEAIERWVRDGGTLLLVDQSPEFAARLGLRVRATSDPAPAAQLLDARRPLKLSFGSVRLAPLDRPERVWPDRGEPLASIYRRGRGEIWIVQRPGLFRNEFIRDADNALAICRFADVTSRNGAERIYFDEYFHGMREKPGAIDLLLRPPALWVTLQGLGLLALLLWRFLPRFGPLRPEVPTRRRSKEEFLDAMAYLLTRKGAHAEAFAMVRDALARDLELALGLPAATPPEELAAEAARRRPGLNTEKLARALSRRRSPSGADGFVRAVNELERLRREFFHE